MGSKKKVTIGYRYFMGVHFVLCQEEVDAVLAIYVGSRLAWSGNVTKSGRIHINNPELFGGEKREGGIVGDVDLAFGERTQAKNDYLMSVLGPNIPAFRGVTSAILRRVYWSALTPYPKPWAFLLRRMASRDWRPEWGNINGAANPAHIVREVITNKIWGLGYSPSSIDDVSFSAAAKTLFDEKFGLSLVYTKQSQAFEFINLVMSQCDGVMRANPRTGRFELKLYRKDYEIDDLPVADPKNIIKLTSYERALPGELINEVIVVFRPIGTSSDESVTVQNLSSVQIQGAAVSATLQYPGIGDRELATKVALRDLKSRNLPLARVKFQANRQLSPLSIGDLFRFSWPDEGISQLVMRVTAINYGTSKSNTLTIDAIEDVFGYADAQYTVVDVPSWEDPVKAPQPVSARLITETPYWDLARKLPVGDLDALDITDSFIWTAATAAGAEINYTPYVQRTTQTSYSPLETADFAIGATITEAVPIGDSPVTLKLSAPRGLSGVQTGEYAYLGNEIVRVDAVNLTNLTATVARGCLDTAPRAHPIGTQVFFNGEENTTDDLEAKPSGSAWDVRLLTRSGMGQLPISSAATDRLTLRGRQGLPYTPGRLRLNGLAYPDRVETPTGLVVSWAHRDRVLQTATIVDSSAANIGPEPGTTYEVEVWRTDTNSRIYHKTGVEGVTDSPNVTYSGDVRVEVYAVRDGLRSWQSLQHSFNLFIGSRIVTESGDDIITEAGEPIILDI